MKSNGRLHSGGMMCILVSLVLVLAGTSYLRTIEADSTPMGQMFQNLIGNALGFHRLPALPGIGAKNDVFCDPIKGLWNSDTDRHGKEPAKTLYVWAGDQ